MTALYKRTSAQLAVLAARDQIHYLQTREILRGNSAHIFIDDVHLTAPGYEGLADAIGNDYALEHADAPCGS